MYPLTLSSLSLALSVVLPVSAQLTKPVMSPPVPFHEMDPILFRNLPSTPYTIDQWGWGWLPLRCKAVAEQYGWSPYDINVYNVHYNDCDQAWVVCRHHGAELSLNDMTDNFGRLPVGMRNFVRHQFATPRHSPTTIGGATYSDLGDVLWEGPVGPYLRFWAHEAGHAIDRNIGPTNGDWSATSDWRQNYDKDRAIADEYAKTNHAENFAQEVVVALFDKVVPGGIGTISPNWADIYNQYSAVRAKLGDILQPGGRCNRRFADDTIVCMGPAAGCQSAKFRPKPTATQDAALAEASLEPPIVDDFSDLV